MEPIMFIIAIIEVIIMRHLVYWHFLLAELAMLRLCWLANYAVLAAWAGLGWAC